MKTSFLMVAVGCAAVAACSDMSSAVASRAEATRTATEHFAARAAAESRAREARISEEAEPMRQAEAIALGERFYLRAGLQGWTVMDRATNGPASSAAGQPLADLSLEDAQELVESLRAEGADPGGGETGRP